MSDTTNTLSNVLTNLLKKIGFTEARLAREINIPRTTINHLLAGTSRDPRVSTLRAISEFFGVSVEQLLGEQPIPYDINGSVQKNNTTYIPIINWETVHTRKDTISELDFSRSDEWVLIDALTEDALFGLRLQSEAMKPQFQENEILIVSTARSPKNRNYVIAAIESSSEIVFRQFIFEGGLRELKSTNPDYPRIKLTPSDKIIGVVIQTIKKY